MNKNNNVDIDKLKAFMWDNYRIDESNIDEELAKRQAKIGELIEINRSIDWSKVELAGVAQWMTTD